MSTLLDTSALFAAHDRRERDHEKAAAELRRLVLAGGPLIITDLVVAELHALALRRSGPALALALIDRVLASPRVRLVATKSDDLLDALDFLRSRPERPYSLADAVSFLVMRERGIDVAFSLDADFTAEGFEVLLANA